ncbi:hypothetical protein CONPUDRAFT_123057 [Coniophora puteana RWD-64-598 SS2]|uniref:PPM-type phosphatase domain-containing protein n=1 Tax=Coniophora puteana (strain RWD-64-598) TaxID=741705 RepID=A0A5M3MT74_CONPW|nr:uncharacterized protein CONPUDRAFT_123057 [Coniophora puteana RWD-64-598 SS2]EIW82290.1 hypothetical protein CONPUDRAFT_123057 [Coniophora puteana RWD-64-598 SS2]
MLRRAWKPIATATFLIGTPGYFYYASKQSTFDLAVRVRGSDGKPAMSTRTFSLLSSRAVTERLTEKAVSSAKTLAGGITWKHTTASVAANDPIEDASSDAVIKRDQSDPSAPGDWLFFTVMDGHGGPHTSRLLSKTLVNAVVLELSGLIPTGKPQDQSQGLLASIRSYLGRSPAPAAKETPESVSLAIQSAFSKLDSELTNAPIAILAAQLRQQGKDKVLPDLSQHPLGMPSMLPAVSGSCALMAMFDTAHNDLYVACSGDSRAVAGIWEEGASGKGSWRVEVLTEDQTGRNPSELKR